MGQLDDKEILNAIRQQVNIPKGKMHLAKAALERAVKEIAEETFSPSDEKRRERICRKRSVGRRGQLMFFLRHYFPHYFSQPFGKQQKELIADIQKFRGKKHRLPMKIIRAMSRGFGKSTIMSLCGVLWLMLCGTWKFIILVSANLGSAKDFLQKIIEECESNDELVQDFPELEPAFDQKSQTVSWKDNDIVFRGGSRIIAKGFLNAIRGLKYRQYRPDCLMFDDPDTEDDVESESRMRRKYRWFDRAALRLGSAWGVDIMFAYTNLGPACMGEVVWKDMQKYKNWNRKRYKAIETDKDGNEYSTWPEALPLEQLLAEREADPIMFARELQNEDVAEQDQKFKGLIQTYKFSDISTAAISTRWAGWTLALAVDLSLGKKETSDYSAIVGVGMSPDGKVYEIYNSIERRRPDKIEDDFLDALWLYPWTIAGAETTGNQEYFLDGFKRRVDRENANSEVRGLAKIICPIIGIHNDADKIRRINGNLQPPIKAGIIKLRDDSKLLIKQLTEFPFDFKDGPDALDMAVRLLTEQNMIRAESVTSNAMKIDGQPKTLQEVQAIQSRASGIRGLIHRNR